MLKAVIKKTYGLTLEDDDFYLITASGNPYQFISFIVSKDSHPVYYEAEMNYANEAVRLRVFKPNDTDIIYNMGG